jgi:hypothetical protein
LGNFCELKHEVDYSLQALQEPQQSSQTPSQPEPAAPSSKKGKKGKKKPAPAAKQQPAPVSKSDIPQWDLIDHLNTQPSLPEKWEDPPADKQVITDEVSQERNIDKIYSSFVGWKMLMPIFVSLSLLIRLLRTDNARNFISYSSES